jgi:integrase
VKTISVILSQGAIQKYRHQDVMLRDANVPYLFFRFSKSDKHIGSFQMGFTNNGKSTSRVIGRFPLLSIKEARKEAIAMRQYIEADSYTATKDKCFKICGELLDWYREFRCTDPSISLSTKKNVEHHIEHVLKPILSRQNLLDLTPGFMSEQWLKSELDNYQISTLKSGFQCLKAAFSRAHKLGYIKINPIVKISFGDLSTTRIKPRENRIQFWSISKLTGLINGLPPELRILSLLCLGYLTRNQETVMAKWEHFDFKNLLWHIPAENTKTGQGIAHPITTQMAEILKRYKKWQLHKTRSKFLFPQKSGYRAISASQAAGKIALHTNNKFRLHDLRKFGSTALRDMGTDYYIVERILNHKMTQLDQTYIQTSSRKIITNSLNKWHETMFA